MKRLRSFFIVLILLIIVAVAAPFFIKGPDGRPLMTLDRFKRTHDINPPSTKQIKQWGRNTRRKAENVYNRMRPELKTEEITGPPTETLYKWKDADGVWHYTDKPPPEGVDDYQTLKGSQ